MSCEVTNHRNLGAMLQRKDIVLIFQHHDALLRCFSGRFMLSLRINGFDLRLFRQHQVQQFLYPLVDDFLADSSILHGLQKLTGAVVPGGRHFQVHPSANALNKIITAAPIGDCHAVESPFPAKNIVQMGVLIGVDAIDLIVGGHHGFGLPFFDGNLKICQVQLSKRSFVQHAIGGHALQFLAVDGKMLGAGSNALVLNTPDEARRQLASQIGILGIILKGTATERASFCVQPRSQQSLPILGSSVRADCRAYSCRHIRAPAVGDGGSGRNIRRLGGFVQAQMIPLRRLLAQSAGTVGQGDGRNAQTFYEASMPYILTG